MIGRLAAFGVATLLLVVSLFAKAAEGTLLALTAGHQKPQHTCTTAPERTTTTCGEDETVTRAASCLPGPAPNPTALIAISYACRQLGLPYVWGGDGPSQGDAGFDCSGLTTAAYEAARITLPRTAHTQYAAGPPAAPPLLPGDLVFYGTAAKVHHVGLYIGSGLMIHAPTFGEPIQIAPYRWTGDDYLGTTRPAAKLREAPVQSVGRGK